MNAYEIDLWRSVKHNGEFVTNLQRRIIVHARNEKEAKTKVTLKESTVNKLPGLTIEASRESIYRTTLIGTVTIEPFYVYSSSRTSIPVKEYQLRHRLDLES